ncbi:unnamed protein product [Leptidea sinapis]|uniref:Uncharacterized protein n=1 Tax=Leptidea sinapis TaxID=189913 RepID=A0A5E4PZL9_9NEOP|nr:unnamed protein product [Leptidea sinapis]
MEEWKNINRVEDLFHVTQNRTKFAELTLKREREEDSGAAHAERDIKGFLSEKYCNPKNILDESNSVYLIGIIPRFYYPASYDVITDLVRSHSCMCQLSVKGERDTRTASLDYKTFDYLRRVTLF